MEQEDWDSFEQGAAVYHAGGSQVFAYIQSANCVFDGSYRREDWHALDPRGRRITCFTYGGRYIVCMGHPAWRRHLKDRVRGALERGADGIFFDNLFHGGQPASLFGAWLGSAGCYCPSCRQSYLEAAGRPMPAHARVGDPEFARYLRWRADQVTELVAEMGAFANQVRPGTPISANDFDPILRDSFLVYGIDLAALAGVQDVAMIENYGLPFWKAGVNRRLVNNALSLRTARTLVAAVAHLSVLSYDVGIGYDDVFPVRRYLQGIAEAVACNASMTRKGTEYHDGTQMTVLTANCYGAVRDAIGRYHRWLEANVDLYAGDSRNRAPVALLFPGEALWLRWHQMAPIYFAAGPALTVAGIPWRVIRPGDALDHLRAVLIFDEEQVRSREWCDVVPLVVPRLPGWQPRGASLVARSGLLRRIASQSVRGGFKAYNDLKPARRLMDRLGMPKIVTQSPLYRVPDPDDCQVLLDALPAPVYPRLTARSPALIEVWDRPDGQQIHLVNYADEPQRVTVELADAARFRILSPDGENARVYRGDRIELDLDIYQILHALSDG